MLKIWKGITTFGKTFGIICIPIAFCEVIGHPATVVGSSMEPTLTGNRAKWWQNDIVWLSKLSRLPKNGDIYTFICPRDPKVQHVKRVRQIPGDYVKAKNGKYIILGAQEYWMLSDNSTVGDDSRNYGPVNFGLFQSKATFILWPPNRFGSID